MLKRGSTTIRRLSSTERYPYREGKLIGDTHSPPTTEFFKKSERTIAIKKTNFIGKGVALGKSEKKKKKRKFLSVPKRTKVTQSKISSGSIDLHRKKARQSHHYFEENPQNRSRATMHPRKTGENSFQETEGSTKPKFRHRKPLPKRTRGRTEDSPDPA